MSRIDSPLIGSGSQEEVDLRVQALFDLGTSRGYLTYEELNERLPDEVVSPDKLDSLLMMIDEMGIKLIDDMDIGEFQKTPRRATKPKLASAQAAAAVVAPAPTRAPVAASPAEPDGPEVESDDDDDDEVDLNLDAELAEASTKRIDDPVRMFWRATIVSNPPWKSSSRSTTAICRSIAP